MLKKEHFLRKVLEEEEGQLKLEMVFKNSSVNKCFTNILKLFWEKIVFIIVEYIEALLFEACVYCKRKQWYTVVIQK